MDTQGSMILSRCFTLTAILLLSVAPLVNMISLGSAPINSATCFLAVSTNFSASQPNACVRECGFPHWCSEIFISCINLATDGAIGVVDCASR